MDTPAPPSLSDLVQEEIGERPVNADATRVTEPAGDLIGLALSGGGIRSATFNLGVLQGLNHFRLLERVDYLSTVSGGGYIGSFWTAWRSRTENQGRTFPGGTGGDGRPEPPEVRHLREFSNFLAPRLGVLTWDTGRILVSMLSSAVPSLLTALAVIALAVLAWCLAAYGLFALGPYGSTASFTAMTGLLLVVAEYVWRQRGEENDGWQYSAATVWALACTGFVWAMGRLARDGHEIWPESYTDGTVIPIAGLDQAPATGLHYLFAPVAAWGAVILIFALRRWLTSTSVRSHGGRVQRNSFDRVHSRLILAAAIWTVVTTLWIAGVLVVEHAAGNRGTAAVGLSGATAAVILLFAKLQKRVSEHLNSDLGRGVLGKLRPLAPQLLAYLATGLMVVGVVVLIVLFERSDTTLQPAALWFGVTALAIVVLALLRLNANEVGLHTFYRARLSRAYLGASNPDSAANRMTEERQEDDLALADVVRSRPCHLICCAANDLANRELGNLHRGAESAVISRAGFSVAEECRFWSEEAPAPTISAAITASGAAFNTLMGGKSKELGPAVTFLMAALNLRLGLWLPRTQESGPLAGLERAMHGLPFMKEMFGVANSRDRHVHLSDGGHFENMAVYELIRRHCRFIIASDCGMDPAVSFDDLGNLVRRVRADFGVDIQIDLSPLRPDEHGLARQAMVAGDIHYPEGDTGVLLLFKPALTGNEPADVAQYRTGNPVFPHETTVDQFYDEAQWESYRRLGEHAAHSALGRLGSDLDPAHAGYATQLFARARREGQPKPAGFDASLSHFADRVSELDGLLRQPECATLLREVYKEIDAIDREGARVPLSYRVAGEPRVGRSSPDDAPADGPGEACLPAAGDLAPSLHLIRRVLLLMQELHTRDNLEERYHHPLYLGTTNYFARWTAAPLFRMWWPILKTMYPQPFTRFVERVYGLRSGARRAEPIAGEIGPMARTIDGFAMRCWAQESRAALLPGQRFIPFLMKLRYHGTRHELQAAQVVVARVGPDLVWDCSDFYVPPGLWGAGIGESFLRQLCASITPGRRVRRLLVRINTVADLERDRLKRAADERQLYRSAGFWEIAGPAVPEAVRERLAREDAQLDRTTGSVRWMEFAPAPPGG